MPRRSTIIYTIFAFLVVGFICYSTFLERQPFSLEDTLKSPGSKKYTPPVDDKNATPVFKSETLRSATRFATEFSKKGNYSTGTKIPRIIHHTWKTKNENEWSPDIRSSINSWNDKNQGYLQLVWDDNDVQEFVEYYFSYFSDAFKSLPMPVLRADIFRYMVLSVFGGIYSDIDTHCLKPIDTWAEKRKDVKFIVGIEADAGDRPDWNDWYARQLQWCQWTIASAPGHPVVMDAVFSSIGKLYGSWDFRSSSNVMESTGPGIWTDAVNFYLASIGSSWKKFKNLEEAKVVGDSYILTVTGFSPGVGHMGSKSPSAPEAFVQHMFKGSWKDKEHS
ncbi:membrane-bound alpha-1,6- mannosyltransferase Initiation-specific [Nowakowskiella sp. JEL0078]|nr:membrane-bound alpha-1,6- mannosyltransferase Initiation-specific [Nowakowskiella sp. JEL0078]